MQNVKEEIRRKINCWSKPAWSNQDIMLCLDIGETKASQLHQMAKRNHGIIRALKTKVKPESVCSILGLDYKAEIKRLMSILRTMEEES